MKEGNEPKYLYVVTELGFDNTGELSPSCRPIFATKSLNKAKKYMKEHAHSLLEEQLAAEGYAESEYAEATKELEQRGYFVEEDEIVRLTDGYYSHEIEVQVVY